MTVSSVCLLDEGSKIKNQMKREKKRPPGTVEVIVSQLKNKTNKKKLVTHLKYSISDSCEAEGAAVLFQVGAHDSLNSIALKFNITPNKLVQLNKLFSRSVYPGQVRTEFSFRLCCTRFKCLIIGCSPPAAETVCPWSEPIGHRLEVSKYLWAHTPKWVLGETITCEWFSQHCSHLLQQRERSAEPSITQHSMSFSVNRVCRYRNISKRNLTFGKINVSSCY